MAATTLRRTTNLYALQCLAVNHITQTLSEPRRNWRRHGIGVLQSYIREESKDGQELRLHVWDRRAIRKGIYDAGDIHNHRFDFESTILLGKITHDVYELQEHGKGWQVYDCTHARADLGARYRPLHSKEKEVGLKHAGSYLFREGDLYTFKRGAFHRSRTAELTVTLVLKKNQTEDRARIVGRKGVEMVHAFEKDDSFDMKGTLIDALRALVFCV